MLHGRGVQGTPCVDGGEAPGDETGGEYLQKNCKSYTKWTNRYLIKLITQSK